MKTQERIGKFAHPGAVRAMRVRSAHADGLANELTNGRVWHLCDVIALRKRWPNTVLKRISLCVSKFTVPCRDGDVHLNRVVVLAQDHVGVVRSSPCSREGSFGGRRVASRAEGPRPDRSSAAPVEPDRQS